MSRLVKSGSAADIAGKIPLSMRPEQEEHTMSFRLPLMAVVAAATLTMSPVVPIAAQTAATPSTPMLRTPPPARTLVAAAVRKAAAEHKNVLVTFGASWCGWCHRFEAFLADTGVGPIMAANFVELELVTEEVPAKKALENPGSEALKDEMGGGNSGLPFFFVLDSTGKKIGDSMIMPDSSNVGHPDKVEEVAAFDRFLTRVAPRITAPQRARIKAYFDRIAGRGPDAVP
jgi:thiol-disulfide isomerase/thioredoxin